MFTSRLLPQLLPQIELPPLPTLMATGVFSWPLMRPCATPRNTWERAGGSGPNTTVMKRKLTTAP